jgi:hypothetical protein
MKKLWALDIPGLPLRAFQPRLGGMCLYGGGGSNDGPGGTDTRDEGLSYSDMYGGTSGSGVDYEALAEASRIASGQTALNDVRAAQEIASDMVSMGYTPIDISTISSSAEGDYGASVFGAIEKANAGQPLSTGELNALAGAGLGSMVLGVGRTVDTALADIAYEEEVAKQAEAAKQREIAHRERMLAMAQPVAKAPAPVDESGPGGVGVSEERTVDYGVPLASEGAAPTERTASPSSWSRFGRVSAPAPVTAEEVEELPDDLVGEKLNPAEEAYSNAYLAARAAGASAADARAAGDRAYDTFINDISTGASSGMAQEISPPDLSGRMPDTLVDIVSEVASRSYDEAYSAAVGRGASPADANAAGQRAMEAVYGGALGLGTVSPGEREESDVGYVGGPIDQLGDVSGLGADRPAYEVERGETSGLSSADRAALNTGEGYGTGFGSVEERQLAEERDRLSREIDALVPTEVSRPDRTIAVTTDVPMGPPPAGFTGPVEEPRFPDDTGEDDRADQLASMPAIQGFWQADEQGRIYYVDERGVRMSPAGVALDPEEERWGSTPAREPGTLPANLGGTSFAPPMEGLGLLPQEFEELRLGGDRGQQGLSMGDIFLKDFEDRLSFEPTGQAGASGWTPSTRPQEGEPGFVGPLQSAADFLPSNLGQLGLSMGDIALKDREDRLSYEPTGQAGASGWTPDTMPREGDPGFMGPVQAPGGALPSGAAGAASGALPGALPGTSMSPDLESRVVDILDKVRDTYAYRDGPRSTTGLSRSDLQALVDAGLGKYDLSESQTIDQALASLKTGQYLEQNMPSIIGMLAGPVPQIVVESIFAMKEGYKPSSIVGTIVSSVIGSAIQMVTGIAVPGQAVQDLAQGNVGKAAFGVGVTNVAARLGLPVGTVNAALSGNLGAAAANQMLSEVVMESAKTMGADPGLIATIAVKSGLGQSAFEKIAGAINDNSIVRGINDFMGEISSGIKGFGIDTGLGEALSSRQGAVTAGDASGGYDGSYGGSNYESEQAGLIADAIQGGQPKKKLPRWSDLFFSNLARDMGASFAGPPPVDRGELDDLEESLSIANAYGDPSRRQDVLDPLGGVQAGGDRLDVDVGGADVGTIGGAQDKTDLANIIREYAQLNDPSFVIYDDGTLGIKDYDLNVVHKFDSAGNVLGTYPAAHSGSEPTSDVAKELLSTSYVSSLFGDRGEQITRRLAGTEGQDRMSEEEYRALFGSGQSANPPTSGTGQAVFGDVSGTFGSRADALAAFPGLSLVSKDTGTGDETYEHQGFTIIAKADGSVTATPKDQPTVTVDLVAPTTVAPPPPAPSTAPPPPVVRPEDLVVPPPAPLPPALPPPAPLPPPPPAPEPVPPAPAPPAPAPSEAQDVVLPVGVDQDDTAASSTTPIQADTDTAVDSAPTTPTGGTTADVTDTTQGGGATGTIGGGTATTDTTVGGTTGGGLPSGGTQTGTTVGGDTSEVGQEADLGVTQPTPDTGVGPGSGETGTGQYLTRAELEQLLGGIQIPPGLSDQDVFNAISKYMTENPGMSLTDVSNEIGRQLADYAKKSDFDEAIRNINFPPGLTPGDVTGAITDYMTKNPGLSPNDVSGIVNDAIGKLPVYATPGDVTGAINTALSGYATSEEVGAIGEDVKGLGTQLGALEEAQKAAEEAEKERVRLQLQQQAQGQMLSTASGFQSRPSGVVEQYKASFLDPFIVGGEAPEFKSPLAGFTQSAITGGFLPSAPSQKRVDATSGDPEYFRAAEIAGIAPPLQIYDPTQEFKGLFGFRQGGLVPAFAQGGTRHGENAHGALRVLEHSGKHRVDYRQGDAVTGIGDGQSDDIPAMLADGEFVIPADVVAALGNGSTKAGSDKLYDMMHSIRRHHRSAGPKDLPPPAKSPLEYIKPRRRAK